MYGRHELTPEEVESGWRLVNLTEAADGVLPVKVENQPELICYDPVWLPIRACGSFPGKYWITNLANNFACDRSWKQYDCSPRYENRMRRAAEIIEDTCRFAGQPRIDHCGVILAIDCYQQRIDCGRMNPTNLSILADYLEDNSNCPEMITSLRENRARYRGYWVIDSILGKS